ncbi:hypothetical protein BK644_03315 [Pseudomonas protegens]|jgi:hypothetical protein|nr:hypothetical protein BK644_03315 [Pseudomonas protegens]
MAQPSLSNERSSIGSLIPRAFQPIQQQLAQELACQRMRPQGRRKPRRPIRRQAGPYEGAQGKTQIVYNFLYLYGTIHRLFENIAFPCVTALHFKVAERRF